LTSSKTLGPGSKRQGPERMAETATLLADGVFPMCPYANAFLSLC
jgi:hypothetical protein